MKITPVMICAAILITAQLSHGGTGLALTVESSVKTVRVGGNINLTFNLTGIDMTNILGKTEGVDLLDTGTDAFTYTCGFRTTTEGKFVFGPYSISLNGQTLTSKPLAVTVLPKWNGAEEGSVFRIDRDKIILGEAVELVMEIRSQRAPSRSSPTYARIKRASSNCDISSGPMSVSASVSNGKTNHLDSQTWVLTPKEPGVFKITGDLFESLPDGVKPPDFAVTVEPAAQPVRLRPTTGSLIASELGIKIQGVGHEDEKGD